MKKMIVMSLLVTSYLNATTINVNVQGVLLEKIKNKELKFEADLSSITLEIDLAKKDTLAKIERDAAKELADYTERKNDLEFFKEKYSNNMYAKTALVRIKQEEKDLVFMHEKYIKSKTEKVKQLMDENYIPDEVASKGQLLLKLKKKLEKIKATLKFNLNKYSDAIKDAKESLKKSNELLIKEIDL